MSDNFQHIDVDSDEFEEAPKALRDHVKKLQKRLNEQSAQVSDLTNKLASRAVADVLADKGFKNPAKVQRDILADQIDPTDKAAVEAWLAENSDDYARAGAQETESAPELNAEDAAAAERMNNLSGTTTAAGLSTWEQVQKLITPEMTGDQLKALYAQHGI